MFVDAGKVIISAAAEGFQQANVDFTRVTVYAASLPNNELCSFAQNNIRRRRQTPGMTSSSRTCYTSDGVAMARLNDGRVVGDSLAGSGLTLEQSIINALDPQLLQQIIENALVRTDSSVSTCTSVVVPLFRKVLVNQRHAAVVMKACCFCAGNHKQPAAVAVWSECYQCLNSRRHGDVDCGRNDNNYYSH